MGRYIARRLLLLFPTMFLVSVIVFTTIRLIPGDVVTVMFAELAYAPDMDALREKLGLTKPIHEQYLTWMGNMLHGDFGESLYTKNTALYEMQRRLPVTLELGMIAMILALLLGIPIGVISAIRQDTWVDYTARSFAIAGLSVPDFWIATIVVVIPALLFKWSPALQYIPFDRDPLGNLAQFMVPAAILGLHRSASIMRMTRAMMLEVLRQDYIRTAWSKGLRESAVVFRHALRNALIPVITTIGLQIPFIIGGAVILEQIFSLPGVGRFMLEVIQKRDYPMLQTINMFFAFFIVITNLIVDLSYALIDPRIRFR